MEILINELSIFRNKFNNKIIGTTGLPWEFLNCNNSKFLQSAKNNCDILIIGLYTGQRLDENNESIPSLDEIISQIKDNRYVDYYFTFNTQEKLTDCIYELNHDVCFKL